MIVTTGGASNAHSDLTRSLLAHMEIDFKFVGLSMKPGKWTSFGLHQEKPVFCLSGTPSAVYVGFHLFVLPALLKQMGHACPGLPSVEAVLEEGIQKRSGLEHVVQGVLGKKGNRYQVKPLTGPGVQVFSAMAQSNALVFVDANHGTLEAGESVFVQPLNPAGLCCLQGPENDFSPMTVKNGLPPIISIVGKSDAGKTTLLEKFVPELTERGYRVGTIKHDVHGFDIDHEGKDSWRHKQAGACTVVISSPRKVAVVKDVDDEQGLDHLLSKYFRDADIVITEGYKREAKPKIEIFRSEVHDSPLCTNDENLVAIVSDAMIDLQVPRFGLEDISGLADLVEAKFCLRSNQAIRQHLV
jgi:molybdopterin-guanine dinucleotide biosynthesis protein B